MRIYTCDEPELRVVCEPVDIDDENQMSGIASLKDEMASLMYASNGCGIAATQVGYDKRFVIVDCEWDSATGENKNPMLLINPKVEAAGENCEEGVEGCLSVPGVNVIVERPTKITFSYYDEAGARHEVEADGLLARCVQHEIDHLDGITLIEKVKGVKRMQALAMLSAARKQGAVPGSGALYLVR